VGQVINALFIGGGRPLSEMELEGELGSPEGCLDRLMYHQLTAVCHVFDPPSTRHPKDIYGMQRCCPREPGPGKSVKGEVISVTMPTVLWLLRSSIGSPLETLVLIQVRHHDSPTISESSPHGGCKSGCSYGQTTVVNTPVGHDHEANKTPSSMPRIDRGSIHPRALQHSTHSRDANKSARAFIGFQTHALLPAVVSTPLLRAYCPRN